MIDVHPEGINHFNFLENTNTFIFNNNVCFIASSMSFTVTLEALEWLKTLLNISENA